MAAVWAGYKWAQFMEMEGEQQSEIIATYRAHLQIQGIMAKERIDEMNKQGRKRSRR